MSEDFSLNTDARYSEILEELLGELGATEILRSQIDDDYSGKVDVDILLSDGRIFSYYYSYGSCSECDEWELNNLTDKQIKEIMLKESTIFNDREQYMKWLESKDK